jgi:hypothetical protein
MKETSWKMKVKNIAEEIRFSEGAFCASPKIMNIIIHMGLGVS